MTQSFALYIIHNPDSAQQWWHSETFASHNQAHERCQYLRGRGAKVTAQRITYYDDKPADFINILLN